MADFDDTLDAQREARGLEPTQATPVSRVDRGVTTPDTDLLAVEEPMEIRVEDRPIAVLMRTPGADDALAAGFLFTERIVDHARDIAYVRRCWRTEPPNNENIRHIMLRRGVRVDFDALTRHTFASSSCGICGKATLASVFVESRPLPIPTTPLVTASVLNVLGERLRAAQAVFAQTGGLHAAGLFNTRGELLSSYEDVGRHNAVDKVIGEQVLKRNMPLDRNILMVSGRASFEIIQKALAARIPVIVAVSAPSSLAVELARFANQTLVAFARGERYNIYTHPQRVELEP